MGPPIMMTQENKTYQNKMLIGTDRSNTLPIRQIDFYGSKVGRNVKAKVDSWRIKPPSCEEWKISSPSFRQEQKQKKPQSPVENFQLSPFKTAKMLEEINLLMTIRQVDKNLKSSTTYLKSVQRALNKNFKKSESLKNIKRKSSGLEIPIDYKKKNFEHKTDFKPKIELIPEKEEKSKVTQVIDFKPKLDLKPEKEEKSKEKPFYLQPEKEEKSKAKPFDLIPEKDENSKVKTLMSFWNEQFSNRPMTVCNELRIQEKRESPISEPTFSCVEEEHTLKPSEFKNKKANIVDAIKMSTNIRKTTSHCNLVSKSELNPSLKSFKTQFSTQLKVKNKDTQSKPVKNTHLVSNFIQYEGLNWNFVLQPGIFRPIPNFEIVAEPFKQDLNFEQYFSLRDYRLSKRNECKTNLFKIRENLQMKTINVVEYFKKMMQSFLDEKLKINIAVALILSLLAASFYIF